MKNLSMQLTMPRRLGTVTPTAYWADKFHLPTEPIPCFILGVYQSVDGDWSGPVVVCELPDGCMIEVPTSNARFVNVEEHAE